MSSVFEIETAKAVFEVLTEVYGTSPWTYEQVLLDITNPNTDYFFVYDAKEIVGFLSLQQLVGECELTNIAVKSSYQKKGYGKLLLDKLDDLASPIFLEVRSSNVRAQHLYQKAGFKTIGKRYHYYHNPVEDAIIMKR
ncbi:ribosomal protein S18-alanine N-acetyltransferase [Streptococcus sciuri]|uniref:[Ribosomal protein bS18]-alanine N-acetyltransferase n=1 Tax=Streptococcus sciuri TaxID=2973939 RepID=A0ABT2F7T0_9STRE|nr:ribosomal protein S18-alanine N-acetyltransferase [Streptococcus sciuri]MCS4488474.1 ribosomal protein S18-alanine N-acetyltransferase [Streptococcus sciuri]